MGGSAEEDDHRALATKVLLSPPDDTIIVFCFAGVSMVMAIIATKNKVMVRKTALNNFCISPYK